MKRLRPLTTRPLIAKLSPDVTDIRETARACRSRRRRRADVNTFVGMAIDLERMRSKLGKATGGLSGPAIKPMALARCHEAAHAVRIPVIGSGGISSGRDALEFIAGRRPPCRSAPRRSSSPARRCAWWTRCARLAAHGVTRVEDFRGLFAPAAR